MTGVPPALDFRSLLLLQLAALAAVALSLILRRRMSHTLFWYVFRNLLSVFLLASGVIAGIMSFGGLLKPLTETGLDVAQVGEMLAYAMPAMTTYSYPIAALFATTAVYGRLSSDNEVTAVRAAGISLGVFGLGFPALVLGLIVSFCSLLFLSFVVPAMTLKVEKTVVSNIGQFVVSRIEEQHQVRLQQTGAQPLTIFARSAWLDPTATTDPNEQAVTMEGVSIVIYGDNDGGKLQVPEEFYVARTATAFIRQPTEEEGDEKPVLLRATLEDGMKFPRNFQNRQSGSIQGGVRTQSFGPFEMRSPLRENTKFMDIRRLQELQQAPEKSRRMSEILREMTRADQQEEFMQQLIRQSTSTGGVVFDTPSGDRYVLSSAAVPAVERNRLVFGGQGEQSVTLSQVRPGAPAIEAAAREARVRVFPNDEENRMAVSVELQDVTVKIGNDQSPRVNLERSFEVAMPKGVQVIRDRTAAFYKKRGDLTDDQRANLERNLTKQNNSVISEMHSRASFALSCLVLTMVGYGLGVRFKSGNYLTAFAVSVVPALLSIVLVVTGQHICENIPTNFATTGRNPLQFGLIVIWSGNAVVLGLAVVLMEKLRRT
jgi:lipopolysaccharide export LptBFGC system permease protein LptF